MDTQLAEIATIVSPGLQIVVKDVERQSTLSGLPVSEIEINRVVWSDMLYSAHTVCMSHGKSSPLRRSKESLYIPSAFDATSLFDSDESYSESG